MRRSLLLAGATVLVAAAGTGAVIAVSGADQASAAAHEPTVSTAIVERGPLSDQITQSGTLTYRGRPDGAPYTVFNRASGIYTELPGNGDRVDCGGLLYRVNDKPVLLLCGSTPMYRSLSQGARGPDVAELNSNLVHLGYANRAQLGTSSESFSAATASALAKLQSKVGEDPTGALALGRAVILPRPLRIATVAGELGGPALPGARVMSATADTLEVQLALDPSQQGAVREGDRAQITLPSNNVAIGKVARLGRIAAPLAGQSTSGGGATIPVYISLDHPDQVGALDQAPVQVTITTRGVAHALNVPVTAIVGRSGGGFAVEVVRGGQRELVAVTLGLFDAGGGRVQVDGAVHPGDRVVVPSS